MAKSKRQVFYSFHFTNDVMRVQQIRNMGVIEGNSPVSPNDWETAKKTSGGIERWIDDNMKYRSCVVVLVGSETASRPWVQYEIQKAWTDRKGLVGIHIHNLRDPRTHDVYPSYGTSMQGVNPFATFKFPNGVFLSSIVHCYNPSSSNAYGDIQNNIERWIEEAIIIRNQHG